MFQLCLTFCYFILLDYTFACLLFKEMHTSTVETSVKKWPETCKNLTVAGKEMRGLACYMYPRSLISVPVSHSLP